MINELQLFAPNASPKVLQKLLSFGYAIKESDMPSTENLPDFPCDNLKLLAKCVELNPMISVSDSINCLYPYRLFLPKENHKNLKFLFDSLEIPISDHSKRSKIISMENVDGECLVKIDSNGIPFNIIVPSGNDKVKNRQAHSFIETSYQNTLLADIMSSYAISDICLVGPRGSGKSIMVSEIAQTLNQKCEPMVLFQDMTARDLIQQRTTTANGDTIWRDSPLVTAAKAGTIAILDGIHRIHNSTISILHRLVHDRELQLFDGSRLLRHDKYDELVREGQTENILIDKGIFKIQSSFRIVALAEPGLCKLQLLRRNVTNQCNKNYIYFFIMF